MMSRAKGLLKRFMHELTKEELCSVPDELQAEIEELLAQPEQDLDALKKDWVNFGYTAGKREQLLAQSDAKKREPIGLEIMDVCGSEDYREGFKDGVLYAEKWAEREKNEN